MPVDLLITGAVVLDASAASNLWQGQLSDFGAPVDIAINQGRIVSIQPASSSTGNSAASSAASSATAETTARQVLAGDQAFVMPGLCDIQVHFRTPGAQESEDIASGSQAAAMGGVTACLMMPNTVPPIDSVAMVRAVTALTQGAVCDVRTSACVSVGRAGQRTVDFLALHNMGVRVFTDDGDAVADPLVMRAALQATTTLAGAVISQHAEDPELVAGGVINAGKIAQQLGVAGRPAQAEERTVARDLELTRQTGGRYHVLHLSTAGALALVAVAKSQGLNVTAEVTPQHLTLTEQAVLQLGTDAKMNPPLRSSADVAALRGGLVAGTLDAVATDHAPHHAELKALPLAEAPPGMLGVETMASVLWTEMVASGEMSPRRFVETAAVVPAQIAGIANHGRPVAVGEPANLVVFDPHETWTVDRAGLHSRSVNTPWHGRSLTGKPRHTVLNGKAVVVDGSLA